MITEKLLRIVLRMQMHDIKVSLKSRLMNDMAIIVKIIYRTRPNMVL